MKWIILLLSVYMATSALADVRVLSPGQSTPDGNFVCGAPTHRCTIENIPGGSQGYLVTDVYLDGIFLQRFRSGVFFGEDSKTKAEALIAQMIARNQCSYDQKNSKY